MYIKNLNMWYDGNNNYTNELKVGDKVIKNEQTWEPNDFDDWGRGIGTGIVVKPPFELDNNEVDVRWPNGRCFELTTQLKKVNEWRDSLN